MNLNINNISSFLTSIAEGHLYQSFYHQRMGLLRLGLVSEYRVTKNTTNDTNFSHIFFNILNIIVDYFKTTLTSADTKQKNWLLIPKVASIPFMIGLRRREESLWSSLSVRRVEMDLELHAGFLWETSSSDAAVLCKGEIKHA